MNIYWQREIPNLLTLQVTDLSSVLKRDEFSIPVPTHNFFFNLDPECYNFFQSRDPDPFLEHWT
jgi:hypothetical protein